MPSVELFASQKTYGLALAALLVLGCAEQVSGNPFDDSVTECRVDDDCYSNESCLVRQCVISSSTSIELSYIVEPNPASQFVETHLSPEDIVYTGEIAQLRISKPRTFNYQVLDGDQERVSASIYVYSEQRPSGFELVHSETYLAERSAELNLIPGPYRIRFEPKQGAYPGVDTKFTVKSSTEDKTFLFPETFRKIEGVVYGREKQPVSNVEVRAISQTSRIPSSTAVTDDTGAFSLKLPETLDAQFTLVAKTLSPASIGWTYRQSIRIDPGEDRRIDIQFPEPEATGRVNTQIIIRGNSSGNIEQISNARVVITATSEQAFGSFEVEAKTNDDGIVTLVEQGLRTSELSLLPGTYKVEVIPPKGSRFRRTNTSISIGSSDQPTLTSTIDISKRVRVVGAVLSHDAQPIPNTTVAINFVSSNDAYPSPGTTATTDDFGQYEAWLDPGDYLLQTSPDYRSASLPSPEGYIFVQVPKETDWQLKPLVISRGARQRGIVSSEDGEPLVGAMVVPYLKYENTVIQLQSSTTDAFGEFNIVVPSVY
ncbi:MAG: hypothetical protein VYC39_06025 [Myxococcota bacterium]|nr:hypothetical protein [Myxococcota bacterium]